MAWARFDDNYSSHPKVIEAGPWAELLDMRGVIYCARYDTDGRVTRSALTTIGRGIPKLHERIDTLVSVGRWKTCSEGGWFIHDFLEYNVSKAARQSMKDGAKERTRRYRDKQRDASLTRESRDPVTRGGDGGHLGTEIARCDRCGTPKTDPPTDCCAEVIPMARENTQ